MKQYIKILLREGLLTEITSREAWDKFYSDATKFPLLKGDVNLFNKIEDLYPKNGNQHNKGYFMWIYKQLKNGLKEEDFYKVKEYLRLFVKFINRIDSNKRDISKYNTIQDLYSVVKDFENNEDDIATSKTSEIKKIKEEELDLVFSNSSWSVYVPLTEKASCLIGKGTQWCTAAEKSNNMFDHYNGQGKLYVLINKDNNSKYQLHFESNQLMDENDREVAASYFFDYVAEDNDLYEFLKGVNDNFYQFILETSVKDIEEGTYSETFNEALDSLSGEDGTRIRILNRLRDGYSGDGKYIGFIYEDDPSEIENYQVKELFNEGDIDSESTSRILTHLIDIGFDFENAGLTNIFDRIKSLQGLKLEIGKTYKIDKGRKVNIKGIDFESDDKPYNIDLYDSNGKVKSGFIGLEALGNLVYNKSLFEVRNKLKGI
jgi:hypothetical protein